MEAKAEALFQKIDIGRDGKIQRHELEDFIRRVLAGSGSPEDKLFLLEFGFTLEALNDGSVRRTFKDMDIAGEDAICLGDFVAALLLHKQEISVEAARYLARQRRRRNVMLLSMLSVAAMTAAVAAAVWFKRRRA